MVLKWLTIVFGALIAVGRGIGFVFPELAQKTIAALAAKKLLLLALLLVVTIIGAFFIGLSHEALGAEHCDALWETVVLLVFGIVLAGAGLLFLAVPKLYNAMLLKAQGWSLMTLRVLFLVGVIFGLFLVYVGVRLPAP